MALLVTWSGPLWTFSKSQLYWCQSLDRALRYLLIVCYTTAREEFKLSLVLSQGSNVNPQKPPRTAELLF